MTKIFYTGYVLYSEVLSRYFISVKINTSENSSVNRSAAGGAYSIFTAAFIIFENDDAILYDKAPKRNKKLRRTLSRIHAEATNEQQVTSDMQLMSPIACIL
jgi:hypothetical protein